MLAVPLDRPTQMSTLHFDVSAMNGFTTISETSSIILLHAYLLLLLLLCFILILFEAASEEEEGRNGSNSNHFAIENQLNRSLNGEEIDFVAHFRGIYFNYGYILSLGEAYVVVFIIDASLVVVAFLSCIFSCHCYETIGTI